MNKDKIIVALDFDTKEKALKLVSLIKDEISFFKIGKQMFTKYGPEIVKDLREQNCKVFLDLKFHDIPNTVFGAIQSACELGIEICNVHALGGLEMMKKANEARLKYAPEMKLFAVTLLTSLTQHILHDELQIKKSIDDEVVHLATLSQKAGLDGVVCSPKEISLIKNECGHEFMTLTPGIRPEWASSNDQSRTLTPKQAINLGSDYIVIGRPITKANSPKEAAKKILAEIS